MTATRRRRSTGQTRRSGGRSGSRSTGGRSTGQTGRSRGRSTGGRSSDRERFDARRRSAARDQSRRRLRIVLGLTAITTLVLSVIGMLNSSWFDVDDVRVVGQERADVDDVIAASGIEPGQPLIELDLTASAERVADVPWIGSAEVRRAWNGRITIEVVERGPVAALPTASGFALVDDRGRQLEVVAQRPAGYLPIAGVAASGVAGETVDPEAAPVLSVVLTLPAGLVERVAGIRVESPGVVLDLDGGAGSSSATTVTSGPSTRRSTRC